MLLLWKIAYILPTLVLLTGAIFSCIFLYFKFRYTYWARKGIPYLKPTFPIGNNIIVRPGTFTYGPESQEWYNAFKKMGVKFGGVWSFCNEILVLVDTKIIKDIMTKDFQSFVNRDVYHNPKDDPRSNSIFVLEGESWKYMRQKMTPAFTSAKMKIMFDNVVKCSDLLVDLFDKTVSADHEIHLGKILDKFTMDNLGVNVFGLQFNCLKDENNKFWHLADLAHRPADLRNKLRRICARIAPRICRKLGIIIFDREISDFFESIIGENIERRKQLNLRGKDFTQMLIDMYDADAKGSKPFTMDDIVANCAVFFFAGFDTSSKTMQYALLELARNPELQEKAKEDVKRVLDKYNGELTYEGVLEMTYLRQVIDETLRLYPPVPTLSRVCERDYKINGTNNVIKKGTSIVISAIGLQRDPDLFPEPFKFDPDRFSPENKDNIVPYSYLPFGEGPRNCIGLRFGLVQAAIGLARILNNFTVETSPKTQYPPNVKLGVFLLETDDIYVRAKKN